MFIHTLSLLTCPICFSYTAFCESPLTITSKPTPYSTPQFSVTSFSSWSLLFAFLTQLTIPDQAAHTLYPLLIHPSHSLYYVGYPLYSLLLRNSYSPSRMCVLKQLSRYYGMQSSSNQHHPASLPSPHQKLCQNWSKRCPSFQWLFLHLGSLRCKGHLQDAWHNRANCADQHDLQKNSFMTLNLSSGLTWGVQASLEPERSIISLRTASSIGSGEYIHFFHSGFELEYACQQCLWLRLESSAMWIHNVALLWMHGCVTY